MTDTQEIPQWKLDLIEEARKLLDAKEQNRKLRNQQALDWLDTQPPEIKNTSIGK